MPETLCTKRIGDTLVVEKLRNITYETISGLAKPETLRVKRFGNNWDRKISETLRTQGFRAQKSPKHYIYNGLGTHGG